MAELHVFTDGGCIGNPGPGGWAFVIEKNGQKLTSSGNEKETTNNRMELTGVIKALESVNFFNHGRKPKSAVHITTDSQYVKNGITTWIHNWVQNGWRTANKKPVKNQDLWIRLKELSDNLPVEWFWTRGHAGHEQNEECDSLVKAEMVKLT